MTKSPIHHLRPQIASHYGQMGIFQLAHKCPILIFLGILYTNSNEKMVNFMKIKSIISVWGPILQAVLGKGGSGNRPKMEQFEIFQQFPLQIPN